jgi:hypothetical protein
MVNWGLCPQAPGIYRILTNPDEGTAKGKAAQKKDGHPSWSPPRRSGRVPALPCPPGGSSEYALNGADGQELELTKAG